MSFYRYSPAAAIFFLTTLGSFGIASAADLSAMPVKASPVVDAPFFFVNDNRVTYAYEPDGASPGVPGKTAQQNFAFTHFDVWKYGTNLINLLLTKSDHGDPASPCGNFQAPTFGCAGATEFVGVLRSTLGFNEVFDTHAFTAGPLRNVSWIVGVNGETKNSFLAPNTRRVVGGLQFAFDLPYKGFFNVSPLYYQEWSHGSFNMPAFMPPGFSGIPDGNSQFQPNWAVEMNYYMDLGFLPANLQYFSISGRAGFYGPKGNGAYGNFTLSAVNTKTEINSEPVRLTFDMSKLLWGEKYSHFLETWVAYRYWHNKYGYDDGNTANRVCFTAGANNGSCTESSVYTGVTMKF